MLRRRFAIVSVQPASNSATASGSSLAKDSTDIAEYGAAPSCRGRNCSRYCVSAGTARSGLMWCANTALIPLTAANWVP